MGSYIQPTDLSTYFPEATIIEMAGGDSATETLASMQPDTAARVNGGIASGESIANSKLSRMTLPISPVPEGLKRAVAYLSLYFIYKPHMLTSAVTDNLFQDDYDRESDWLDQVKDTDLGLGGTTKADGEDVSIMTSADDCDGMVFGGGGLDLF